MWNKAVVVLFRLISQLSAGNSEENYESFTQDNWSPDRDLNVGPLRHESDMLITLSSFSITFSYVFHISRQVLSFYSIHVVIR
jgi:hypothetical protein